MRSRRVNTTRCRARATARTAAASASATPVFQPGDFLVVAAVAADDEGGALATGRTLAAPVALLCCFF